MPEKGYNKKKTERSSRTEELLVTPKAHCGRASLSVHALVGASCFTKLTPRVDNSVRVVKKGFKENSPFPVWPRGTVLKLLLEGYASLPKQLWRGMSLRLCLPRGWHLPHKSIGKVLNNTVRYFTQGYGERSFSPRGPGQTFLNLLQRDKPLLLDLLPSQQLLQDEHKQGFKQWREESFKQDYEEDSPLLTWGGHTKLNLHRCEKSPRLWLLQTQQ